jgi:hypothetical protein
MWVSLAIRMASENEAAPTGIMMNSWKARSLDVRRPPPTRLIIGTGSTHESARRWRCGGIPAHAAAARAAASETPSTALAPSRDLSGVPSSSQRARSRARWSPASLPTTSGAIADLTLRTAVWSSKPR